MIRSGKTSDPPWLKLSSDEYHAWATFHDIAFNDCEVEPSKGPSAEEARRGSGLVCQSQQGHPGTSSPTPFVNVPPDMVLSEARVVEIARGDSKLAELLRSCEHLLVEPRISILVFLLFQATISNPAIKVKLGRSTPFKDYLRFLPLPEIPTLYPPEDLALFAGTTLVPAAQAKMNKLRSEFRALQRKTKLIPWLGPIWWEFSPSVAPDVDEVSDRDSDDEEVEDRNLIQFDDWLILDAMYRSRAMEWPGEGEAMVPGIDMANHKIPSNVEFKVDSETREGLLLCKEDTVIQSGEELCLSYGDHKSPVEFILSYGFLPDVAEPCVLIPISLPDTDPLAPPKAAVSAVAGLAPGIRIYSENQSPKWDSDAVWLLIVNEEDGLGFKVARGVDGQRQIIMTWKEKETDVYELKGILEKEETWEVFLLRATVTVLNKVDTQLERLEVEVLEREAGRRITSEGSNGVEKGGLEDMADRLRWLEGNLLREAQEALLIEKENLVASPVVERYLAAQSAGSPTENDGASREEDTASEPTDDFT